MTSAKSLAVDVRKHAKTVVPSGQGDKGDQEEAEVTEGQRVEVLLEARRPRILVRPASRSTEVA